WNNLDSAIGLLGVWYGAEAGIEVPPKYWQAVQQHWLNHELPTGQWYSDSVNTTPSIGMTWAGDWALRVTQNWMNLSQTTVGRQTDSSGLLQAMKWLESADNSTTLRDDQTTYVGFNLFMLNLVGQAGGYKYLGSHNWYHEIAGTVVPVQWPNGAFGRTPDGAEAVLQTAYAMIFLSRGLHPVYMEKLHFSGVWNNRPRDLNNLSHFTSRELERSLNWEVMPTAHDWTDWLDSPVLYIASHESPALSPAEKEKLRAYVLAGGMLFTHADAGNSEFKQYIEQKLVRSLFPNYKLQDIPANDPIYSIQFPLKAPLPKLRGVSNGSRWLLIDSPVDLSANWQIHNEKIAHASFELATNLFVYASGKTEPRSRLALTYLSDANPLPQQSIKITRLSYGGNWDPEPYSWTRFDRWMLHNANLKLQIDSTAAADLQPGAAKIAVLTGTADYSPTDREIDALKNFVNAGGWLLIDDCGGDGTFAHCIESAWLPRLSTDKPQPLEANDPILAGDSASPSYREGTLAHLGNAYHPMSVKLGQGRIIYSSIDLTTGLLGANTASILGYQPASAMSFAKNVLLESAKAN
ncbi:MAG TPA: DUF4159 domain-containing protein, partial [Tepidisphaeraceae bacterium]|nr:DUF4159 domain-containing protein [Tepidisphaeraceae bacterium]